MTVAEVTSDKIAEARDACAAETFTKRKPNNGVLGTYNRRLGNTT
jgi:hypothetical protein